MQNETNFPTPKMNITSALTKDYENEQPGTAVQNETNLTRPSKRPTHDEQRATQNKFFKSFSKFSNFSARSSPHLRAFFPTFYNIFKRFHTFPKDQCPFLR
jgi:hypothetical protein